MPLMARAAKQAGAKMIRTSSVRDIVGIKEETGLPVIGLIKREYPGYTGRITMTMREVDECVEAMADIVSIDCTNCTRGDGLTPAEFLKKVKAKYPNMIIMADCATYEEAVARLRGGGRSGGHHHERLYPPDGRPEGRPQFRAGGTAGERTCPARSLPKAAYTRPNRHGKCWSWAHGPWWSAARSPARWKSPHDSWRRSATCTHKT